MDDLNGRHVLGTAERLDAIERKLDRIERSAHHLAHALRRPTFPLLNWLIRPRGWTFQQYPTRRLRVDPSYALEPLPFDPPRIAIVTPSFNQGRFVRATIDSVLSQNYPNLAYRVQDGGSSDTTTAILKSYGDRLDWVSQPDDGHANAVNQGLTSIDGDIMAYLNSDDMLLPGTLAYVARAFSNDPGIDLVYGQRIYVDAYGLEIGRCVLPPHHAETLKWMDYVPQETLFWRRRVWESVGPFDETFQYALDWDFLLRAQAAGFRFQRLPRFMGCFRVHDDQKTTSIAKVGEEEMLRLRIKYLGEMPGAYEIRKAITAYLIRQRLYEMMNRLRIYGH